LVILLREPSDDAVRRLLDDQRERPFSYAEVGVSRDGVAPAGYPVNAYRRRVGTGAAAYARAVDALRRWRMYALDWTRLCGPTTPPAPGLTAGVLAHHLGVWSLNAIRVVYVLDDDDDGVRRSGFAIGTLPAHVERGEERFTVEWHQRDDTVWYDLFAFATPSHPLARAAYPLARRVQRRFARDSAQAIEDALRA
jgi:uncharacterized protein (UPF0548 family)